jgi:hypothetical protein
LSGRVVFDLEPSAEAENKPDNKQQSRFNRVLHAIYDKRIIIELTALFVATRYACLTHSIVAEQALVDRPVFLPAHIDVVGNNAPPFIVNFGKTVARDVIGSGEVISVPSEESEPPYDPHCREYDSLLANLYVTTLAHEQQDVPPDLWKLTGIADGAGRMLYAVGYVYYNGLDGTSYYTDV